MKQAFALTTPLALIAAGTALAGSGLPRSLNFDNQTATRVHPTVAEDSFNEKEVEFADIDKDGDLDVVVAVGSSDFGQRRNKLYINEGGVFEQNTTLIPYFVMTDVTRNAFIRDFNDDTWNDLYIINDANTDGYGGKDHVFIAQHSGGVLTGFIEEGATRIASQGALGAACGGVSADFNLDGHMDVYSGNYPGPSQDVGLYNNGQGADFFLNNVGVSMIPSDSDYTVDVALADMNGDGSMDLLISNHSTNYVYYNDLGADSSGPGDFNSSGSRQDLGAQGAAENAMEPADFDNDGDNDFYWSNASGGTGDRIYENTGNNGLNQANFVERNVLPSAVTTVIGRKASVADFNDDGRIDVFVGTEDGARPTVLRNVSTGPGDFTFVDWTPADAFPSNSSFRGWHAAVFDTGGDGDIDILLGAFTGDHLFENVPANEVNESDLAPLPPFWNVDPVAVTGSAVDAEVDEYTGDVGAGFVSVVLNGPDDYRLEVLNQSGGVVGTSDRGGLGVEEALQVNTTTGAYTFRVTVLESSTICGPPDFDGNCEVNFQDLLSILNNWGCTDCPQDLDGGGAGFTDLVILLGSWGSIDPENQYLLEILGRAG